MEWLILAKHLFGMSHDLLLTLISAAVGGVGVKALDYINTRQTVDVDGATKLREELRDAVAAQREEIASLTEELQQFKERVFELSSEREELSLENQHLKMLLGLSDTTDSGE